MHKRYSLEKFSDIIINLTIGEEDARGRLSRAYHNKLMLPIQLYDDQLDKKFKNIKEEIEKSIYPNNEGRIPKMKIRNSTASKIILKLLNLYHEFEMTMKDHGS